MNDERITPYAKGILGESRACEYLCQRGMTPLFQRVHSPFGEIDLVMMDQDILAMVEVKTRERATLESAMLSITPAKQKRLALTARHFLGEHPEYAEHMVRFDIVLITKEGIYHLPNAFEI